MLNRFFDSMAIAFNNRKNVKKAEAVLIHDKSWSKRLSYETVLSEFNKVSDSKFNGILFKNYFCDDETCQKLRQDGYIVYVEYEPTGSNQWMVHVFRKF